MALLGTHTYLLAACTASPLACVLLPTPAAQPVLPSLSQEALQCLTPDTDPLPSQLQERTRIFHTTQARLSVSFKSKAACIAEGGQKGLYLVESRSTTDNLTIVQNQSQKFDFFPQSKVGLSEVVSALSFFQYSVFILNSKLISCLFAVMVFQFPQRYAIGMKGCEHL